MSDLGNPGKTLRLQCKHCGWVPPGDMQQQHALLHFQVEHDTDDMVFDLVPVCSCGAVMTVAETRPWPTGGFKDYLSCGACGNTGYLRREPEGSGT